MLKRNDPSMQTPKHLAREAEEQRIIAAARDFSSLKHDYDDCGSIHASSLETRIIDVENLSALNFFNTGRTYRDAFLSLQAVEDRDYNDFFSALDGYLQRRSTQLRKAETVFLNSGKPYAFLALTYGENFEGVGTIDTYVGNSHYLLSQDASTSGFYSACASISDIGANGAEPTSLHLCMINVPSSRYRDRFLEGVIEASNYCGITDNVHFSEEVKSSSSDMVAVFTVSGTLIGEKQTTLTGLSDGMNLYIAGKVGGAALHNYQPVPRDQLKYNLNPDSRREVILSLSYPSLVNDVSDGVEKSLFNLLRYTEHLSLEVSESALLKAAYNNAVTLDHIKYGGDDYSLVIATHSDLEKIKGVTKIGVVKSGEQGVKYY